MPVTKVASAHLRQGLYGSLAGGLVFGVLMHMMDMMPMVAMLVRSESIAVGWGVHLVIAALFAIPFAFLLAILSWHPVATGALWGSLAWVGGAFILMPLFLGMPGMVFNLSGTTPWFSLLGHMMYGLVAGGVALAVERREAPARRAVGA